MGRVFADTNVLFPFSVMDVLLALSEDGIHDVVWTDALLAEWEEVIVREQKRTPETATSVTAAIRDFFANSKVERVEYEHLIDEMPGADPDDHEHMAAAVVRQPCTILTRDTAGFPSQPLAERGVRVTDPDTYLCELADELAGEVADTIVRLAGEKRRPPKTPQDLLDDLAKRPARRPRQMLASRASPTGSVPCSPSAVSRETDSLLKALLARAGLCWTSGGPAHLLIAPSVEYRRVRLDRGPLVCKAFAHGGEQAPSPSARVAGKIRAGVVALPAWSLGRGVAASAPLTGS